MIRLFGLSLQNLSMKQAVDTLAAILASQAPRPAAGYFVNAHAARLAAGRPGYRRVLRRADLLFVDGIGIRIAAALRGRTVRANLVGTDLVPSLLGRPGGGRCFLLGGSETINRAAASHLARAYPHWQVVGRQHGYLDEDGHASAVDAINASGAELLLVGMGNPLQEEWIDRHAPALRCRLCLGVGGLFHHWAGDLKRAPAWVRRAGLEWVQLCLQKPERLGRYAIDIPLFLAHALRTLPADRRAALDKPVS